MNAPPTPFAAHTLAVYGRETRAQVVSTWRTPQFLAPSILLPLLFYGIMGLGLNHGREEAARYMLATYVIFASIAPAMFGFGAAVATERESKLIELKQVSPLPVGAYLAGRLAAALALVAAAVAGLGVLGLVGGVTLAPWRWAAMLGLGLASAVPFALIGLNLGLRLGSQGATASANLLFLGFSLFGGLWFPLAGMPAWMSRVADVLPSYHLGQLSLMLAGMAPVEQVARHISILAAITAAAGIGALVAWRRQAA
jgi:ABC-2 type transport system permease protein